jgi:hypothetical protein
LNVPHATGGRPVRAPAIDDHAAPRLGFTSPQAAAFEVAPFGSKPAHEQQDDEHDQDDADDAHSAVTVAIAVAAEATTEATKQEDDKDDDEYEPY